MPFKGLRQNGKKSRFSCLRAAPRLLARRMGTHTGAITNGPNRSQEATGRKLDEHRGSSEVTSISYLPTTFTTLFFLAASLLLGYIQ